MSDSELGAVVTDFASNAGLRAKAGLRLVRDVLGATDWVHGPGDDAAAIPCGDDYVLVAGEAVHPPFVAADPRGAGVAAVVANVNDIAAMGGRPLGIVDQVVAPEDVARAALEGIAAAARCYGVPVVGGHLTARRSEPFLAASIVGRARTLLSCRRVAPGQRLLAAFALEGHLREDFPFFSTLEGRADALADDVAVLAQVAESGACLPAQDVSMAGTLGPLAMLLEPSMSGASVDLAAIPRPPDVALRRWLGAYPSFGFILCCPPERAEDCRRAFARRGLACEAIGAVEAEGALTVRLGSERATLMDLARDKVTFLS